MKNNNCLTCKECNGCKHQLLEEGGWCYMFKDKPQKVPCAQHDVYASNKLNVSSIKLIVSELISEESHK